jgi:hypothetical protein
MPDEILSADDFMIDVFEPDIGGDSGMLRLAALRSDKSVRYVVKGGSPEIACNEFMYHHIAAALGMYTQEARLIQGSGVPAFSVGIRFIPNAQPFRLDSANEENRRMYYAFETLYVILNEEDSHEYYIDEQERVFKLDNAASFNLQPYVVRDAMISELRDQTSGLLNNALELIEYEKYGIIVDIHKKRCGQAAVRASLDMFRRFSELDETLLGEAFTALGKLYPKTIVGYYRDFIRSRKNECGRFLAGHDSTRGGIRD